MKACLARELEEELMIEVKVLGKAPLFTTEVGREGKMTLHMVYETGIVSGSPSINPNVKQAILKW